MDKKGELSVALAVVAFVSDIEAMGRPTKKQILSTFSGSAVKSISTTKKIETETQQQYFDNIILLVQ